jgi:hypothetical protein
MRSIAASAAGSIVSVSNHGDTALNELLRSAYQR